MDAIARDIHSMSSIWIKIGRFVFERRSSLKNIRKYVYNIFKLSRWWTSTPPFSLPSITNSFILFHSYALIHFACAHIFLFGNCYLMDARLYNDDVQYWVIVTLILAAFILGDDAVTTTIAAAAATAVDVVTIVDAMSPST